MIPRVVVRANASRWMAGVQVSHIYLDLEPAWTAEPLLAKYIQVVGCRRWRAAGAPLTWSLPARATPTPLSRSAYAHIVRAAETAAADVFARVMAEAA